MTSERWQQIDRLFHAALELGPEKRQSFLAEACPDDLELRQEVESLLGSHEHNASFLDIPAYELAAEFLADALGGLAAGQQIGPYQILGSIGTGGMGQVYLAHDNRLGRKIALKLLPPDFARDQHRVRRFAQEARAASALNHPNVCVIYEVGKTSDGRHFIAMEHIDGVTLRERIAQSPLNLIETLAMAEQIASALASAHAAGVIHRDIKPENIMVRKDGYVKVLDFGLAKLNESSSDPASLHQAPTVTRFHTEPGTQMGTVRYMAPEHLRERPVDERADIWSFGIVLYEMVTGFTPFDARSRAEIIALILKKRTASLASLEHLPDEFQRIVAKALSKTLKGRYSSITDLAADLKKLQIQLQGEGTVADLPGPVAAWRRRLSRSSLESVTRYRRKSGNTTNTDRFSSALSYVSETAGHLLTGIRQHPGLSVFGGLSAVLLLLFLGLNSSWLRKRPAIADLPRVNITPLTNAGQSVCAAISPDGKSVVHAEKKDGGQQLVLTNIATAVNSVIVPAADTTYRGLTFSRDGNYLYFTRTASQSDTANLYQLALPGNAPKELLKNVDSAISFSPTGDRFAFVRAGKAKREYSLVLSGVDDTREQVLATKADANTLAVGPAWSPDGRTIVCATGWWEKGYHAGLIEFDAESGAEKPIKGPQWYSIYQVAWIEDKSSLIVSAKEHPLSPVQLWRLSYPGGESVRITNGTVNYDSISLSRDGNTIVSVQGRQEGKIWVAPVDDADSGKFIASTVGRVYGHALTWTLSGKIVLSSMAGNNLGLSSINADGSNPVMLTVNAGDNYTPRTTPDGRFIVFASNRSGSLNIWRINAEDGSSPKQLTFSDGNSYPSCSPDGQWVLYDNQSDQTFTVWKVSIDGGEATVLANSSRMPVVSPTGQFFAARYSADNAREIGIFQMEGNTPFERLPILVKDWQQIEWKPDGQTLTYIETANGVSNIWSYDRTSRKSQRLTNFTSDEIFAYAWSPDFTRLACLRGGEPRDVTMINYQH